MTLAAALNLPEREPVRRVWIRYAAVLAGLVTTLLILLFLAWPEPYLEYVESTFLPKYEQAFGFRGGRVATSKDSSIYAIIEVVPGGRLARAGVRSGDIPYFEGSTGIARFYDAITLASAGKEGTFSVISDRDDYEGKGARRIILGSEPKPK